MTTEDISGPGWHLVDQTDPPTAHADPATPPSTVGDYGTPAKSVERLQQERDAALQVAASSYREAMTDPIYTNGVAGPSLAELAGVEVREDMPNFQVQAAIADEMRRWLVPLQHRPSCPSGRPCTSWTCLVDVCVLTKDADGPSDARFCIICGVSLDLHPSEGQSTDPTECGVAARKAELLERAFSVKPGHNDGTEGT